VAYFEWDKDLVIDDSGPIDQDHLKLIDLVNELHTATSQGRGQEVVRKIMGELMAYTKSHFSREEGIMEHAKFPQLATHKMLHAEFVNHMKKLQEKHDSGSQTVASQLSALVRDWLSIHIRERDKEFSFFQKKNLGGKRT
jgi:hemerythrin-like metal-binding protein